LIGKPGQSIFGDGHAFSEYSDDASAEEGDAYDSTDESMCEGGDCNDCMNENMSQEGNAYDNDSSDHVGSTSIVDRDAEYLVRDRTPPIDPGIAHSREHMIPPMLMEDHSGSSIGPASDNATMTMVPVFQPAYGYVAIVQSTKNQGEIGYDQWQHNPLTHMRTPDQSSDTRMPFVDGSMAPGALSTWPTPVELNYPQNTANFAQWPQDNFLYTQPGVHLGMTNAFAFGHHDMHDIGPPWDAGELGNGSGYMFDEDMID
jgi:hypothetical protein